MKIIKGLITVFISFFIAGASNALTAYEIMKKVDERDTGKTQISKATMVLIDKKDRKRVRKLQLFSKDFENVDKSISFFTSPSDVKDTAFLSYDWEDDKREDDSWLYLPSMQRVNRIASSDKSNSWMGSDFTFSDVEGTELNDYNYELLAESDPVGGHDCWKIQSLPKSKDVIEKTGYLKSVFWVRKDALLIVRNIINVKKGKRIKYFSAKDIENINGIWTARTIQMVTTKNKKVQHSSVFKLDEVSYNKDLKDTMFEVETMQRGL
ncbi:MAG: outer membrane lipoprotein-sorting protein [Pseudomonadota bacterium]|nr:outer membrane lipoprotein-sorting protein [Pseudomonadota bacterium]